MNLGLDTTIPEASAEFSEGHQFLEFLFHYIMGKTKVEAKLVKGDNIGVAHL